MRISHTTERLLPLEQAPFIATSKGEHGRESWRGFALVAFRWRLLVDFISTERRQRV